MEISEGVAVWLIDCKLSDTVRWRSLKDYIILCYFYSKKNGSNKKKDSPRRGLCGPFLAMYCVSTATYSLSKATR